jgi:hypothetical protein
MSGRDKAARILVVLGTIVLFVSAALHSLAYRRFFLPAIGASNLNGTLQSVARASFLAMAWGWIVVATVALVGTFGETRLRKAFVLMCALAILAETALTVAFVGFFIGNELIGTAGLLILFGGLSFEKTGS